MRERISTLHLQTSLRIHRCHHYQKEMDTLEEITYEIKIDLHIPNYILPSDRKPWFNCFLWQCFLIQFFTYDFNA